MKKNIVLFALFICLSPFFSEAQTNTYKSEFGFRTENDSYLAGGKDRYYTNGLLLTFRTALDQSKLRNKKLNKMILEFEAGQKIYNPQSGRILDIVYVDRPFAGYLYAGAALNLLYNSENNLKLSVQSGTIGPAALAKEVQELMHNGFGFYQISGWQWQIKNELAINATAAYNYLINRSSSGKLDFSAKSYINIGNTFSGAGAGIMLRTGAINPFYNSASLQSRLSKNNPQKDQHNREFFFYAKPMLHFIAYDATIQGGLFIKDKGPVVFDIKPVVLSQQVGAIYSQNRFTVDFSIILKTREVESIAKPHQFGSIALYYKIN
ncbi:MAG: lipid A deacylase LpxR family protein [Bacteroidetes bacterium]|jgi:lipid A 3-O-deacylase|uniref:lipid A deacylase LpxR family protein n=1 Tax=Daejeonella sp. TaxID=2805397 RepID=UPI00404A5B42|nr:lipid A deacylase LpxR family protein [Bacteroidota bacterium]